MGGLTGWIFDMVMRKPVAEFSRGLARPFATQEATLRRILAANAATEFGRRYRFEQLLERTGSDLWRDFRRDVPIRPYEEFLPEIERMCNGEANVLVPGRPEMFSLTSGTSSAPKFCPVTRAFIKEHHRQHLLWMYNVYRDHPGVNQGKYLVFASPAEMGRTAGGIPYGAMSGRQVETQSIPVRRRMAVPALIGRLEDAESRWFNLLLFALAEEDIRVAVSVNPSTLTALGHRLGQDGEMLLDAMEKGHPAGRDANASATARLLARRFQPNPERARRLRRILKVNGSLSPAAVWPRLEAILTWQGGAASFYRPHVAALWGSAPQRCLGLRASEGTFSIPLRDFSASGVLALGGHAMEFLPAGDEKPPRPDAPTLLAGQLEEGELYRLIATTSGGLYRYDLGDLVRVTGFVGKTPEVAFERRAGATLSATGEKVTEDQAVGAMLAASGNGPLLNGFTLTWEMDGATTRYVLALECVNGEEMLRHRPAMLREWARQILVVFDDELMHRNCEYQSKRDDGRIAFPRAVLLADRSYEEYRARLAASGKPEGQVKPPVLARPSGPGRVPVPGCAFFEGARVVAEL